MRRQLSTLPLPAGHRQLASGLLVPGEGQLLTLAGGGAVLPLPTPLLLRNRPDSGLYTFSGPNIVDLAPLFAASGYGAHLTQATASRGPTLTTLGSRPALLFTAASTQFMQTAVWSGATLAQPLTAYVVGFQTGTSNQLAFDGLDVTHRTSVDANTAGPSTSAFYAGVSPIINANDWSTPHVVAIIYTGASSTFYRDGVAGGTTGNPGTQTPNGLTLGGRFSGTLTWNGPIAEYLLFQGAHTGAQVATVTTYLRGWYGI